jgi:hypothetical protein
VLRALEAQRRQRLEQAGAPPSMTFPPAPQEAEAVGDGAA